MFVSPQREKQRERQHEHARMPVRSEAVFANKGIFGDNGQTVGNEQDAVASSRSGRPSLVNLEAAYVTSRFDDKFGRPEEEKSEEQTKK